MPMLPSRRNLLEQIHASVDAITTSLDAFIDSVDHIEDSQGCFTTEVLEEARKIKINARFLVYHVQGIISEEQRLKWKNEGGGINVTELKDHAKRREEEDKLFRNNNDKD